jgi:hypothetical protein
MDELARHHRASSRRSHGGGHYGGVEDPRKTPPPLKKPPAHSPIGSRHPGRHSPGHQQPHHGSHGTHHTSGMALGREHAIVQGFDPGTYTATIQLLRSPDVTLSGVPVSRAIGSGQIAAGQTAAVLFFDPHNPADAMVVGVY